MMFQLLLTDQDVRPGSVHAKIGNSYKAFISAKLRIIQRKRFIFGKHEQGVDYNIQQYNNDNNFNNRANPFHTVTFGSEFLICQSHGSSTSCPGALL